MKRILINGITLDNAVLTPLLTNVKYWQIRKCQVYFLGSIKLKEKIIKAGIIREFGYIEIKPSKKILNRIDLIFEGLRRNWLALKRFKQLRGEYDIIYTKSSVLDLIILPYWLKKIDQRIKWLTVFDNSVSLTFKNINLTNLLAWLFFQLSLGCLKHADKVFVISQDLKNFLLKKGFKKNQLVLTGNAVEVNLIKRAKSDKKYNIDALYVGRLNPAKGIYDLLKVLQVVIKKYPNFQLAIVSKDDKTTEKKFKSSIQQLKLANNIQFLGYWFGLEKFNIFKSSKIFWFLSHTESFGIALLEAVCCGLPAIAYDLPAYKNIYQNNEVFIVPQGDWRAVAEKTIEIFNKQEFNNEWGELLLNKYGGWQRIARVEYENMLNL